MTPGRGEWRSRLLLAAFSTLGALVTAEFGSRIVLRPAPPRSAEGTPISEVSATLGWRTRSIGSQRIRREDFDVAVSINRLGLRGPEIPYAAEAGVRRLAIMGDSFAHGYYADEPLTLRGRLAQALGPCKVDVLNAGSPGYSTDQEWIYFREEIKKYGPREVMVLFYYNDLYFNTAALGTANRPKPLFEQKNGSLQVVPPVLEGGAASAAVDSAPPASATTFRGSALWGFAAARLQRRRPDWSRTLAAYGLSPSLSKEPPAEYLPFGPGSDSERARVEEMWRRTEALLGGFRDDVLRGGASFSVFYVPARFEANDDAWTFVKRRYEALRPWDREAVRKRLGRTLVELGIPLIDATDAFRIAEKSGRLAYLPVDGHWNARGNEIAYESVFPAMRRAFSCVS